MTLVRVDEGDPTRVVITQRWFDGTTTLQEWVAVLTSLLNKYGPEYFFDIGDCEVVVSKALVDTILGKLCVDEDDPEDISVYHEHGETPTLQEAVNVFTALLQKYGPEYLIGLGDEAIEVGKDT